MTIYEPKIVSCPFSLKSGDVVIIFIFRAENKQNVKKEKILIFVKEDCRKKGKKIIKISLLSYKFII